MAKTLRVSNIKVDTLSESGTMKLEFTFQSFSHGLTMTLIVSVDEAKSFDDGDRKAMAILHDFALGLARETETRD